MQPRTPFSRFRRDARGMAAVEFALIAPALIVMFMGILEMTARYRASEEATRYVNQVADLLSRESTLTTSTLSDVFDAAPHMMKPLDTNGRLDLDVASIAYEDPTNTNTIVADVYWRRVKGNQVPLVVTDADGLGDEGDSVIRIGVRYEYTSPISSLFGGPNLSMVREAYARPRLVRQIPMDGVLDSGSAIVTF